MLSTATASAAASPGVDAAISAYDDGDIPRAMVLLDDAARTGPLDDTTRVKLHWYRGACLYALGRRREANNEFDALLRLRPLYQPSSRDVAPPLRDAFMSRARRHQRMRGVALEGLAVERGVFRVKLARGDPAEVWLLTRARGDGEFRSFRMAVRDRIASVSVEDHALWNGARARGKLEVVLEARDARRTPVYRLGDVRKPRELAYSPRMAPPEPQVGWLGNVVVPLGVLSGGLMVLGALAFLSIAALSVITAGAAYGALLFAGVASDGSTGRTLTGVYLGGLLAASALLGLAVVVGLGGSGALAIASLACFLESSGSEWSR